MLERHQQDPVEEDPAQPPATQIRRTHRQLPPERRRLPGARRLDQLHRDGQLTDGHDARRDERPPHVDQAQQTTDQSTRGRDQVADRTHPSLTPRVLVRPPQRLDRVVVERDIGAGNRREAEGQQELAEEDDPERVVADREAGLGADEPQRGDAQREHPSEAIAHPAGRHLEGHDEQVVERRQQQGTVEIEAGPGEQHEDREPDEGAHERLMHRDQAEIALEVPGHRRTLPGTP